ncbi:MAG: NAD(P)H-binding protein [Burkholderiaceae bacterium]
MSEAANAAAGRDLLIFGATRNTGLVLARLARQSGRTVAAMVRPGSDAQALLALGVDVIEGDAFELDDCRRAVAAGQARTIVSLLGGKSSDGRRIDALGNLNVIEAAAQAPALERFVLVTSMGCGDQFERISEPARRLLGEALTAKTVAEDALRRSALPWSLLRPTGLTHEPARGRWRLMTDAPAASDYLPRADLAAAILAVIDDASWRRRVVSVLGAAAA